MRKILLSLALAASGFAGAACSAQTAPQSQPDGAAPMHRGGHRGGLMGADANHDGTVTRAEMIARATARFDRLDANHDGKLDATERANAREMRRLHRGEMRRGATPPVGQ